MEKKSFILLNEADQIAVALQNLRKGTLVYVNGRKIVLKSDISFGHKFAVKSIRKGTNVLKYGLPIGYASKNIAPGEFVHTHNLKSNYLNLRQ